MVDDDEGVGLVEAIERLIAAIAAFFLADTPFARSCALLFILGMVEIGNIDGVCAAVMLQVWSDGNRCWGQNC